MGPSTLPRGTPDSTGAVSEVVRYSSIYIGENTSMANVWFVTVIPEMKIKR